MKTLRIVCAVLCFLFLGLMPVTAPSPLTGKVAFQQETENVGFKWAFGAMVGTGKDRKFVSVTKDTVLNEGDELKMLVELTKECYVYVIHTGPKGELDLYFPYNLKQFISDYKTEKNYYIPQGRSWFKLDESVGRETFYVLGASERLVELEALLANYISADNSKKPALGEQIVSEIRNVKRKFKTFTTLAEKPITIGGNVRGVEKVEETKRPDVSTISIKISANNFYSKTFSIDHK